MGVMKPKTSKRNNAVRLRLCQDNSEYDLSWNPIPEGVVPITEETRAELAGIEQVSDVSLYLTRQYSDGIFYGDQAFNGTVIGTDPYYFTTCGLGLRAGRLFTQEDHTRCRKLCLLDMTAWSTLFAGADPVGKTLEMQGEAFTVIGIVDSTSIFEARIETVNDYYSFNSSSGGTIYIPIETWPVLYRRVPSLVMIFDAAITSNSPPCMPCLTVCFCFGVSEPVSRATFTPSGSRKPLSVSKCCAARTSVGAISALWQPFL